MGLIFYYLIGTLPYSLLPYRLSRGLCNPRVQSPALSDDGPARARRLDDGLVAPSPLFANLKFEYYYRKRASHLILRVSLIVPQRLPTMTNEPCVLYSLG